MKSKYVIIDNCIPVIFPAALNHKDIIGNITSAGFFSVNEDRVICYGFSQSLNMKTEEGDAEIIQRFLKFSEY